MFLLWLALAGCCGNSDGCCVQERGRPCACAEERPRQHPCCPRRRCCTGFGAGSDACCDECYYIRQYSLCGCNCSRRCCGD